MSKRLTIDYRKSVITACLLSLFIFFAIYGPLERSGILSHVNTLENEFFSPQLITDTQRSIVVEAGLISQGSRYVLGEYGLVNPKAKSNVKAAGMLSFDSEMGESLHNNEWSAAMRERLIVKHGDNAEINIKMQGELCYAEIYSHGKLKTLYFENMLHNTVQGFSGPIYLGMETSLSGTLEEVSYITSKETESYLRKILRSTYLDQYAGLGLDQQPETIDAVSGATITAKAMADAVTEAFSVTAPQLLSTYYAFDLNNFHVSAKLTYWWILHIVVIAAIFLYAILPQIKKTKKSRLLVSVLTLIYVGFGLNGSFTYVTFLMPFMGTEVSLFLGLYALLTLLAAVWGKNAYCSYVCPFGAAQMISLKYSPFKSKKLFITNKQAEYFRYVLTIVLVGGFIYGYKTFGNYELFPDLFGTEVSSYWFYVAAAFVVISMRYPMLWCRLACPTGCVLDALKDASNTRSRFSILNKKITFN
ncbi:FMN-binding protein [Reichenbachiella versicolor]|uniref:FMN-binding protein n=1 Tax=Reichenbachiella versicolor TaxID=1821036 RepID=UPI000D6DEB2D|nr:FMN-binding protein [Reichenbachiella versicolor]